MFTTYPKYPGIENLNPHSSPKNSFDHPRHLKSEVLPHMESTLTSTDSCQNRVSADPCHMTVSQAQVPTH